jgi:uncharacterized protein involved in exopolysaccharide biosynthesis
MSGMEPGKRANSLGQEDPQHMISLLSLCNGVLRHWRIVPAAIVGALAVGSVLILASDTTYVVESSFTPEGTDSPLNAQTRALQQFGLGIGVVDGASLSFYTELLRSRELLKQVVTAEYDVSSEAGGTQRQRRDLAAVYGIEARDEHGRIQAAIDELSRNTTVSTEPAARMVRLRVRASTPDLARQINRQLLTELNEFDVTRRQGRASAERVFIEERLAEAQLDLVEAESALERFYENNRAYAASPQLSFAAARMERRINLLQEIYLTLSRSHEQIKIDEVRATPLMTVVDPPEWSLPDTGPPVWLGLLFWLVVGLGLGVMLALLRDFIGRQRDLNPSDYHEFQFLLARARRDLVPPRLWRPQVRSGPPGIPATEPETPLVKNASSPAPPETTASGR